MQKNEKVNKINIFGEGALPFPRKMENGTCDIPPVNARHSFPLHPPSSPRFALSLDRTRLKENIIRTSQYKS